MAGAQIAVVIILTALLYYVIIRLFGRKTCLNANVHIDTIVTVKDAEEEIEQLIKELVRQRGAREGCVWVIDLGSSDDTGRIITLLQKDYPFIRPVLQNEAGAFGTLFEGILLRNT